MYFFHMMVVFKFIVCGYFAFHEKTSAGGQLVVNRLQWRGVFVHLYALF